jgi:hypothetical protein
LSIPKNLLSRNSTNFVGVDTHAGAHGGSHGNGLNILTLQCSRLCLDDGVQQSVEVLQQLLLPKGSLADGAVNDVGLVQTV